MYTETIKIDEYRATLQSRKILYQFIHLFLSNPPSVELFMEMKNEQFINDLKDVVEGGHYIYEFFQSKKIDESLQLARDDFNKLFIGPGKLLAPPWESVYRGKDNCLFDFPTFEVRDLFSQFNIELKAVVGQHDEAEDHILYEIEFVINLIERSLKSSDSESTYMLLKGQHEIIVNHLNEWVPQFTKDMERGAQSKLYKGIAHVLRNFIEFESNYIEELLPLLK